MIRAGTWEVRVNRIEGSHLPNRDIVKVDYYAFDDGDAAADFIKAATCAYDIISVELTVPLPSTMPVERSKSNVRLRHT